MVYFSGRELKLRNRLIVVGLWLALVLLFFIGGAVGLDAQKYFRLARNGVETKGVVVGKEPENHLFVRYAYEVDRQSHVGIGNVGQGNPKFEELKVGDPVRVYYDRGNPDSSLLTDPESQIKSITLGVLFLTIVGPTFCILGLYAKGWLPGAPKR
ncbi:MAG: DUF3592 domain-containing protein [Pyrinomonadaceae bacterium]